MNFGLEFTHSHGWDFKRKTRDLKGIFDFRFGDLARARARARARRRGAAGPSSAGGPAAPPNAIRESLESARAAAVDSGVETAISGHVLVRVERAAKVPFGGRFRVVAVCFEFGYQNSFVSGLIVV